VNDQKKKTSMPNNTHKVKTELLSPAISDVISYRPHWIVRKGNAILGLVLLLLLGLSWVIHYPDITKGTVRLKAIDAPVLLVASTDGKLEKLLVTNEQTVQQGQVLACLQNATNKETVKVIAPVNGKLLFVSFLQKDQWLTAQQQLFYIQPVNTGYYGELTVDQRGLAKIKTGQKVMIKVESYPANEFGQLTGVVDFISGFSNSRDSALVLVRLPQGLVTNYKKEVVYRNNLSASAEIITDNRRLIHRFAGQLQHTIQP
jgi:multidrug resistance efflux pump